MKKYKYYCIYGGSVSSKKLDEKIIHIIKIKQHKYDIKSIKVISFYEVTLSNSDTHR